MASVPACTIASNNYLAFARVFAESYRRFHPDAPVFVCVVDEPEPEVRYSGLPFTAVFADELGIPDFSNFAFRHEVLELNTAVKPFFLSHLRDRHGLDRTFYFDPDILVLDRLTGLERRLDDSVAVLTPHITEPLDNRYHPAERTIRQVGVYNLGFLGLRLDERTENFLDWWQDRMARYCRVDLSRGLFVDQSWMDLAPAYLDDVGIVRDPIYNVAYWNLAQRFPHRQDGEWRLDDRRIGFVHFSGIETDDLRPISKHQNRLSLTGRPELAPLFEHYRRLLSDAGHETYCDLPYRYATFRDVQIRIPPVARRLLRRVDPRARRWEDPFAIGVPDSYFQWLVEPLEFATGSLNRVALAVWESRHDLVDAFPHLCDEDLPRYVDWFVHHGGPADGIDAAFLQGLEAGDSDSPPGSGEIDGATVEPHDAFILDHGWDFVLRTDLSRPGRLTEWLNQPVPRERRRPLVTYLGLLLHRARPDLQRVFPYPCGADQLDFASWFIESGVEDHELHRSLVEPVLRSFPLKVRLQQSFRSARKKLEKSWKEYATDGDATGPVPEATADRTRGSDSLIAKPPASRRTLGINLGAYFDMDTGVGRVGRGTAETLRAIGIPFARVPLDEHPAASSRGLRFECPEGTPFPVTLLHANADETVEVLKRLPTTVAVNTYRIGYWFWELRHFPVAFADRFSRLDEVWAPSRFCLQSYEAISTIPVRHVPPHVPRPGATAGDRRRYGLDEQRFYFLSCFDMGSVPERKNALGVLEAFRRLNDDVSGAAGLLLKITRPEFSPEYLADVHEAAEGLPVSVHTELWSRQEMDQALATCDAFLSLHRSEGLGLLPIESLYLGTPVVSTDYGGVTDFLDGSTAYLVDYRMRTLARDHGPYPAGSTWADPDLGHAVEQMTRVMEYPDEARAIAERGRARVTEIYGLEAASRRFAGELERLAVRCDLDVPSSSGPDEETGVTEFGPVSARS